MDLPANSLKAGCIDKCCSQDEKIIRSNGLVGRIFTFCAIHLFGFDHLNTTKCLKRSQRQEISRDAWLESYGLLKSKDVPPDLREMHLIVGYRPNPSSFRYCLKSVFYPTNESMNFWTHFFALLFIGNKFYSMFMYKLQGPLTDPLYYPLWAYCFGCCMMLIGSCTAHIFNCHSRNVRETCWFCDYTSITLSCFGSAIIYNNFVCPYECMGFSIKYQLQYLCIVGIIGHAVCCYSRRMTSNIRYALRSLIFAFLHVASAVPCLYLYISRATQNFTSKIMNVSFTESIDPRCNLDTTNFFSMYALVTLFCGLTVYFNVSKFPERRFPGRSCTLYYKKSNLLIFFILSALCYYFFPWMIMLVPIFLGTFDIVGHSHQWMHICIALAFYFQIDLIEGPLLKAQKMRFNGSLTPEDLYISWLNTMGVMMIVGICCTTTTCIMSMKPHNKSKKSQ